MGAIGRKNSLLGAWYGQFKAPFLRLGRDSGLEGLRPKANECCICHRRPDLLLFKNRFILQFTEGPTGTELRPIEPSVVFPYKEGNGKSICFYGWRGWRVLHMLPHPIIMGIPNPDAESPWSRPMLLCCRCWELGLTV